MPGVAQLFEDLSQPQCSIFARARGVIEIDQFGHKGLAGPDLLQYVSIRVNDCGSAAAPGSLSIDAYKITLIE